MEKLELRVAALERAVGPAEAPEAVRRARPSIRSPGRRPWRLRRLRPASGAAARSRAAGPGAATRTRSAPGARDRRRPAR